MNERIEGKNRKKIAIILFVFMTIPILLGFLNEMMNWNYIDKHTEEIEGYEKIGYKIEENGEIWVIYFNKLENIYKMRSFYKKFETGEIRGATNISSTNNKDSYVDSDLSGTNFGSEILLHIYTNAAGSHKKFTYIEWTLPVESGTISQIDLYLYVGASGAGNIGIYQAVGAWTEAGITYINQPDQGTLISSKVASGTGWDVYPLKGTGTTNPITENWGETFDFRVRFIYDGSEHGRSWFSKNYVTDPTRRPYLLVTYTPPGPDTPSISTPSNGATNININPLLAGSIYSGGGTHESSQWQIDTDNSFATPDWDSGETLTNLTTCTVNDTNGTFQNELTGETALAINQKYYCRVKYKNDSDVWSSWSAEHYFTTSQKPTTPSIISPTDGSTEISVNPDLNGSVYSDPNLNTHQSSQWQIDTDNSFATPDWDSGETLTNLTTCTVNDTNGTFQNELTGETALGICTTYEVRVRYKNDKGIWSDWGSENEFQTTGCNNIPTTPLIVSPALAEVAVNLNLISISSEFNDLDVGDTHQSSQWQIDTDNSFATPDWDSGETLTNLTTCTVNDTNGTFQNELTGETALNDHTLYHIRVRHKDSYGDWSSWSAEHYFTTSQKPTTPSIISPTIGEMIIEAHTFEFSEFEDLDAGDTHAATQMQIRRYDSDASYTVVVYDSGWDTENLEAMTAGDSTLQKGMHYYVRVRYKDNKGAISDWSSEKNFEISSFGSTGVGGPTPVVTTNPPETFKPESKMITITEKPTMEKAFCEIPEMKLKDYFSMKLLEWIKAILECILKWIKRILEYIWNWIKYIYRYVRYGTREEFPKLYENEQVDNIIDILKNVWNEYMIKCELISKYVGIKSEIVSIIIITGSILIALLIIGYIKQ